MGSIKHSQNKNKKHTIMKHLLLTLALMAAAPAMAAEENDTTIHYTNIKNPIVANAKTP